MARALHPAACSFLQSTTSYNVYIGEDDQKQKKPGPSTSGGQKQTDVHVHHVWQMSKWTKTSNALVSMILLALCSHAKHPCLAPQGVILAHLAKSVPAPMSSRNQNDKYSPLLPSWVKPCREFYPSSLLWQLQLAIARFHSKDLKCLSTGLLRVLAE